MTDGMAEEEEDFTSLPFSDRFTHKNWKVRKQGYEDAAKAFAISPDESDPIFRDFVSNPGMWKAAVLDSNVAAQQEGIGALCAFLKYGGVAACTRSRSATVGPLVEKGLTSVKAGTKQNALEALLLYVELDSAAPVLDDLLPGLSNKLPKIVAATLAAMTALYNAYGVKIVEPKPALKALPKAFSHADKNVRAEASNMAKELYRWLREAMKPLFWDELKDVQRADLEKLFDEVKSQPTPKQARLQRSQQAAAEKAAEVQEAGGAEEEMDVQEEEGAVSAFDLAEPIDVLGKMPADFHEQMASAKWKDRKDALDALYEVANTPRIKDGHYDETVAALAKSMKDANVAVVTAAANCVDVLAKGLLKSFAKYRSKIMPAILERFKERKPIVVEALGQALDSVVASSSLNESLDDMIEFSKHKNPQVKAESVKLLTRSLTTTSQPPEDSGVKAIAEAATRLLTESTEALRTSGAQVLGTLMKIVGERAMNPYMEGLDNARKEKVKEFFESARVKAKAKPKTAAAPASRGAPAGQKRVPTTASGVKKSAPGLKPATKRASTPQSERNIASPVSKPTTSASGRSLLTKPGGLPRSGLTAPSVGLKKKLPGAGPPPNFGSPAKRTVTPHSEDESHAPATGPRQISRGLAGRPLGKPSAVPTSPPRNSSIQPISAISSAQLAELEDLRSSNAAHTHTADELRTQLNKQTSQIHELQNQNAQLIEDHTRDVLSIKAKETQLVRARSDAEAAEQACQRLQRENERLKRELTRTVRQSAGSPLSASAGTATSISTDDAAGIYRDGQGNGIGQNGAPSTTNTDRRRYVGSPSEEKENGLVSVDRDGDDLDGGSGGIGTGNGSIGTAGGSGDVGQKPENWKRAAEVTSQLKARIEQMKAKQGLARQR